MTKLTAELLEKFVSDIKTDGMCDITDHQVESALIRLLAYEQAAEKPYGYLEPCDFPRTTATVYPGKDKYAFMPLYAAPVLPKQPETVVLYMGRGLISKEGLELIRDGISEATKLESACMASTILGGNYHAQPVIPRELRSFVTDADIAALHRFAECCDDPESGGHDLEKEQVQRLEKIGALQRSGRISYITDFGDYLISVVPAQEGE